MSDVGWGGVEWSGVGWGGVGWGGVGLCELAFRWGHFPGGVITHWCVVCCVTGDLLLSHLRSAMS